MTIYIPVGKKTRKQLLKHKKEGVYTALIGSDQALSYGDVVALQLKLDNRSFSLS